MFCFYTQIRSSTSETKTRYGKSFKEWIGNYCKQLKSVLCEAHDAKRLVTEDGKSVFLFCMSEVEGIGGGC